MHTPLVVRLQMALPADLSAEFVVSHITTSRKSLARTCQSSPCPTPISAAFWCSQPSGDGTLAAHGSPAFSANTHSPYRAALEFCSLSHQC